MDREGNIYRPKQNDFMDKNTGPWYIAEDGSAGDYGGGGLQGRRMNAGWEGDRIRT